MTSTLARTRHAPVCNDTAGAVLKGPDSHSTGGMHGILGLQESRGKKPHIAVIV